MVQRWNRCDFPDWKYLPYAAPTLSWPRFLLSGIDHQSCMFTSMTSSLPSESFMHFLPFEWKYPPTIGWWVQNLGTNQSVWEMVNLLKGNPSNESNDLVWPPRYRQFHFRTYERWKRVTVKTHFDKTSPQTIDQNQHLTPCLWVHLMVPFVLRTKNAFCLRLKMWDPQYPLSPLQSSHIVREWMGCPPRRRSYFGSLKPFLSGEPRIPRLNKWWKNCGNLEKTPPLQMHSTASRWNERVPWSFAPPERWEFV